MFHLGPSSRRQKRPTGRLKLATGQHGISKSQLLSKDAADLPVRMALGEAHVIAMTKKALGDAGKILLNQHSYLFSAMNLPEKS